MWDGDSIISIVTCSGLDGLGFETWQAQEIFFYLKTIQTGLKAHSASHKLARV